jgi:hypothetical protein
LFCHRSRCNTHEMRGKPTTDTIIKIQRPVAFRPTLTDGLALSICPILAGWEDMSKEKPDRAISSKKLPG